MADNWTSLQLPPSFVKEIQAASSAVSDVLGTLQEFLDLIKTILEIAKQLANLIASNPIEVVIAQLIAEIERFLDGLLEGFGVHAIFIPIQKQNVIGFEEVAQRAKSLGEGSVEGEDARTKSFDAMVDAGDFPGRTTAALEVINFINSAPDLTGGNGGFWRALWDSTKDEGDPNRPRFPDDFAVTGTALVFGSNDLTDLYEIFELFDALLRLGNRADLSGKTKPTIQNLRGRALPINTESAPSRIGVELKWDALGPAITFPSFTEDQFVIIEFVIIRSTSSLLREATIWSNVFPNQLDINNSNDLPEAGEAKVIARIPNDGFIINYIDRDEELEEGRIYYYSVAPIIEVEKGPGNENVLLPVGNLSNVIRLSFTRPVDSKQGEPPDWIGTPSIASLFPILETLINEIKLALAQLLGRSLTGPTLLDQLIKQIEALVNRGEQIILILDEINNRLAALLSKTLSTSIAATVFDVPTGGMDAWTAELGRRLGDPSDNTKPPFTEGDELVAGFVIVGGAPNLPDLAPLIALLKLFFGSAESNPLLEAIDKIDVAVAEAEKLVFDSNMEAQLVPVDTPDPEEPKIAFDDQMNPVDSVNCN